MQQQIHPIAERSNSLDCGRGGPGSNPGDFSNFSNLDLREDSENISPKCYISNGDVYQMGRYIQNIQL